MSAATTDDPKPIVYRIPVTVHHTFFIDYEVYEGETLAEAAEAAKGDPELYEHFPAREIQERESVDAYWDVEEDPDLWPSDDHRKVTCPTCSKRVHVFRIFEGGSDAIYKVGAHGDPACAGGGTVVS